MAKPIVSSNDTGYCIRSGVPIPFDIEKPLSYESYKKWSEYSNPDYQEKFCHFSGDPSDGRDLIQSTDYEEELEKGQGEIQSKIKY